MKIKERILPPLPSALRAFVAMGLCPKPRWGLLAPRPLGPLRRAALCETTIAAKEYVVHPFRVHREGSWNENNMHPKGMHYILCGAAALGRSLNALYRKKCAPCCAFKISETLSGAHFFR